jgi:lipoprotein-releasing system ATP-binding protein
MSSGVLTLDGRKSLAVEVKDLHKNYLLPGESEIELPVLKGIGFQVAPGERVAIVGKSGAGKSTLLHLLGTLDRPTSGTVTYGGEDVFARGGAGLASFRNEALGFIFQFHHLLPEFSALENVMMPAVVARKGRGIARDLAIAVLHEVGLSHRMEHRPGELSGGERQRVAVARAIVMQPSIILADEPTGNLDAKTGSGIHDLLVQLNESKGISLIAVTHNLDLARRMHRQIRLVEGTASEEKPGTAMDVIEAEGARGADAPPEEPRGPAT